MKLQSTNTVNFILFFLGLFCEDHLNYFFFLGDQEFPTLLHFAARFGFKELVWNLLECIGAVQALYVRNFHGFTALQLAEMHGQIAVSNILKSFLQVVVSFHFCLFHQSC